MTRETSIKVLGLCRGHYGVREMARVLGLQNEYVGWEAPGFNHAIHLTHFTYKGEDACPIVDRWIEEEAEEYWRTYSLNSTWRTNWEAAGARSHLRHPGADLFGADGQPAAHLAHRATVGQGRE